MSLRNIDIIVAFIFAGAFSGAIIYSLTFPPPVLPGDPGAAFFPRLISITALIFCVVLIIQRFWRTSTEKEQKTEKVHVQFSQFFLIVLFVAGLIIAMHFIGSEIAFFAFLTILLGMRTQRWLWSAITSVVSTVIVYIVFVALLNVHLPVLFLPKYINF